MVEHLERLNFSLLWIFFLKKSKIKALAGVAQWTEHWPANQKVAGSIPNHHICLGCGQGPQLGVYDFSHTDVSLLFFLPPFPSL